MRGFLIVCENTNYSKFLADLETDHANIVLVPALIERLEGKPNSKDPSTFRIDLKKNGKIS